MDNLLWAAGGAAVVYLLFVRPLQQRLDSENAGDVAGGVTTYAEDRGGAGAAIASSAPKSGGCGCGG